MNARRNALLQCLLQLSILFLPSSASCRQQSGHTHRSGSLDENVEGNRMYRYPLLIAPATSQNQSTMLLVANPEDEQVVVQVISSAAQDIALEARSYRTLLLPRTISQINNNHCVDSPAYLSSLHPVDVSVINLGSCSSYLNLPSALLGRRYEVITWASELSTSGQSTVSVTAVEGETRVDVTLPGDRKCDVNFGRIRLFCGDVIRLHLLPFETASFHSRSDLSGTTVISSTGKVAVYAGNSGITVGPGSVTDQTMSQLLPVTQWGTRGVEDAADSLYDYVIPSIPDNDRSGHSIRVSSGGVNTSVVAVTTGDARRHVLLAGQVLTLDFADNAPVLLRGDAPLQVVQFVRGATVPSDSGAPASQIIPERRQYASLYAFTNPPGYVHYVIVVIDSSASLTGLVVDGVTVEADDDRSGWTPVGGTTLVTRGIPMKRDGYSTVSHRSGVKFAAFRYSYIRGNCAYAYPAGVATATNQTSLDLDMTSPSSSNPDSKESLETSLASSTWQPPDTSLSEIITTVSRPSATECGSSNTGSDFLLIFVANRPSQDLDLSIYPVALDVSSPVTATITVRLNTSDSSQRTVPLRTGQWQRVSVPQEVELKEIERSEFKAVRVRSNADISVFGTTSVSGSCDGFLALPVDGLGTEYFAVSYFPPDHKTQLGIAAVHDDTRVNVTLRLATRPGIYIQWNGTVYMNSRDHNVIQIRLNAGEAVQLQDNSDLTGTRISSDRPVAVFSGNDFTQVEGSATSPLNASHLVEQIPPVDAWGSTFYVAPLPENAGGYLLKVVASSGTAVVFADTETPGNITSIQLNNPGDFRSTNFSGRSFVTVTATRPVLLVQLGLSTDATSPTMAIVPSAEKYRSEYGFSTGENNSTRHYLTLIVANRSTAVIGNLRLDGEGLNKAKTVWTQFPNNSQMIGASIEIGAGVHTVTQLDGVPFAAYVYGRSVYGCAYSYPAGFCLKSASELTTSGFSSNSTAIITTTTTAAATTATITSPSSSSSSTSSFNEDTVEVSDCSCLTVSSSLQSSSNGVYFLKADLYGGSPVYERPDYNCTLFLYRLQTDGTAFWNIGPSIGATVGAIHSEYAGSRLPYDVARWRVYRPDIEAFVDDAYVTMTCSCTVLSRCRSVEFVNITDAGSSLFDGPFFRRNMTSDGRPVYRHDHLPVYFFYYRSSNGCDAYWSVGADGGDRPEAGSSSVAMLRSDASDPQDMVGSDQWLLYDPKTNAFRKDSHVRMLCHAASPTIS